jgi:SEFIR domain
VSDPVTVFISYTHESNEHADRVLQLANRLRADGIDADVDQYHHSPPEGWPRWMEAKIRSSDFVFVVASATYLARVEGVETPGTGLGVRWEGNLIYQHLYNAGTSNEKFIPVVFSASDIQYIPTPLQSATYYRLGENGVNDYPLIVNRCRGLPRNAKPPLGKGEPLEVRKRRTDVGMFLTTFINLTMWDKAVWAGCVYVHDRDLREPPTLGLLFRDADAAEQIFIEWRKRLGRFDKYNELRISIIEGDAPGKPAGGYTVHIGSNVENIYRRADAEGIDIPKPHVMIVSRTHYMTPTPESTNLAVFRRRFEQFGSFLLAPVIQREGHIITGESLAIHKREIEFRKLSDIKSKNDPDSYLVPEFWPDQHND